MIERAVALINDGATWASAAEQVGILDEGTLRKRVKRMGLAVRTGKQPSMFTSRLAMPDSAAELGYLAGILDGEGHITIQDGSGASGIRVVHVGVSNTSVALLEYLSAIGGGVTWKRRETSLGKQACGAWQLNARTEVLEFLVAVEPFMKIKGGKARHAIAMLQAWLTPEDIALVQEQPA